MFFESCSERNTHRPVYIIYIHDQSVELRMHKAICSGIMI